MALTAGDEERMDWRNYRGLCGHNALRAIATSDDRWFTEDNPEGPDRMGYDVVYVVGTTCRLHKLFQSLDPFQAMSVDERDTLVRERETCFWPDPVCSRRMRLDVMARFLELSPPMPWEHDDATTEGWQA